MARDIRLLTEYAGNLRSFAWVSLLDDGSVSVGLLDKKFQVPALGTEVEIDGVVYHQAVDLMAVHGNVAISNPHFTFHPAVYYHLRRQGEAELFSGLLMVDMVVQSEGVLPWIRAVSNSVTNLKIFQGVPPSRDIEVVRLQVPSEEYSVSMEVDFVSADAKHAASPKDLFIDWHGRTIRIRAFHVEAQGANLWWNHSS